MESKVVKILAIDDNKDNLTILKALINEFFSKALVQTAFNGQKGLEIAEKEEPDVILLDIIMPGMDGYETCRKLKADKKLCDIPVVFVTAIKSDKASRIKALESGADAFLTKPIDESELTAQIRAMLKIREANLEKRDEKQLLAALVEEKTRELRDSNAKTLQLLEVIKQSEERFQLLFNKAPLGYQSLDIEGRFIEVNQKWIDTLGYSREEVIGKWFGDFLCSEYVEGFRQRFPIFKAKGHIHSEFEMLTKDGQKLIIAFEGKIANNAEGEFKQTHCILQDITESKQAEKELLRFAEELEQQRNDLEKRLHQSVNAISKIGELRDVYTAGHQKNVEVLSCAIGSSMGLVAEQIHNLSFGALIHDIGKFFIPSEILNKPGKISTLEYQLLQTHVEESYKVVKEIDFPEEIHTMIYQHHERLDGSGYPKGISGNEIILQSRILAVADVVEAMVSYRPYRPALGIDAALEEILLHRGTKYDAEVVDICVKLFKEDGFTFKSFQTGRQKSNKYNELKTDKVD